MRLLTQLGLSNKKCLHEQTSRETQQIIESLTRILQDADPGFMGLCTDSQELYNSIESLQKQVSKVAELFNMKDENCSFRQVETLAAGTLSSFQNTTQDISHSVNSIGTLKTEIEILAEHTEKFRESSNYLRIIRTNISMESVRTDRSRELFSSLADEIQKLSEKINQISTSMAGDLNLAQQNQRKAETEIREELGNIGQLHIQAGTRINSATEQAKTLMELSGNWLERIAKNFQTIARNISQVIISMQFHDIFRQQLEHVIEALQDIQARTSQDKKNKTDLAYAYSIAQLQIAQIEHVCQEVGSAGESIRVAFSNIKNELAKIDMHEACSRGDNNVGQSNVFNTLINELGQFNNFINEASALNLQARQAIDMVKQTTMALTTYIREIRTISRELSFKALNAIVLTERLGSEGKSLAVLTEEVYSCAGRAQKLGDEVTTVLGEITDLSSKLSTDEQDNQLNDSISQLHQATARMDSEYSNFESDLQDTTNSISEIDSKTQAIIHYVEFIDEIHSKLREQKDRLEQCLQHLAPYASYTDTHTSKKINELHNSYTMEQERAIHNKALNLPDRDNTNAVKDNVPEAVTAGAASNTGNEFDDNIELF
ncbi:MAG: hypothetical protein JXM68_10610 [Sedimentisphaerales bacterium]|nr:hypothetical protein [Sedimentisphaerales bacterium]